MLVKFLFLRVSLVARLCGLRLCLNRLGLVLSALFSTLGRLLWTMDSCDVPTSAFYRRLILSCKLAWIFSIASGCLVCLSDLRLVRVLSVSWPFVRQPPSLSLCPPCSRSAMS